MACCRALLLLPHLGFGLAIGLPWWRLAARLLLLLLCELLPLLPLLLQLLCCCWLHDPLLVQQHVHG